MLLIWALKCLEREADRYLGGLLSSEARVHGACSVLHATVGETVDYLP